MNKEQDVYVAQPRYHLIHLSLHDQRGSRLALRWYLSVEPATQSFDLFNLRNPPVNSG